MSVDLKTDPARKRYEQARDAGAQARRSGRKSNDNPYRGHTALVRDLSKEWQQGWTAADVLIRGGSR